MSDRAVPATPPPLFDTAVVAGVGLIGGSVALGLRQRFLARRVVGLDASMDVLREAEALGVVDEVRISPGEWLREADLVVLAAPMRALEPLARELAPFLNPAALVTDVGSVKSGIAAEMERLGVRHFVPGHPMAGSERGGVVHARAALLENAVWVLTPTDHTPLTALSRARTLVEHLGAAPVVMPPAAHDDLVATISHLPYLASLALTHMVARDERLSLLAAGGFRDLTRVASGDPRMSRDMIVENKEALRCALERFRRQLERLEADLDEPEELLAAAYEGKRTRDSLPVVKRSLLPQKHDLVVAVPDRPNQIGAVTQALGAEGVNIKDIEVLAIREEGGALRLGLESPEEVQRAAGILTGAGFEVRGRS
ncbi:prephenate dehydrogenase [Deinococcus deserti]|uniref:Prephenate dehydrogenase n=1 Tax=Deinococcus deserti (strain DSM 17065 / CIP 109153 / LMG 22923 / VCD115) TaxID=546414 RepID=C1CUX5_DEIDV|nr:prephenate dehydrogenase [Deinococcus deserti]ACO45992.1 putative prephenate dehydrogenase (chorismate mutase--prephenate dehydrogenase) [Deinococcus deserti VCD115]